MLDLGSQPGGLEYAFCVWIDRHRRGDRLIAGPRIIIVTTYERSSLARQELWAGVEVLVWKPNSSSFFVCCPMVDLAERSQARPHTDPTHLTHPASNMPSTRAQTEEHRGRGFINTRPEEERARAGSRESRSRKQARLSLHSTHTPPWRTAGATRRTGTTGVGSSLSPPLWGRF